MNRRSGFVTARCGIGVTLAALCVLLSQTFPARAAVEEFGSLVVRREHVKWPSPESVVRDLHSQDEDARFKALVAVGVPEKLARMRLWNRVKQSVITGTKVPKGRQIELRYPALGREETQQAIVVVQIEGSLVYAAVATPKPNGWERIAVFGCWCKYDSQAITDTFVSLDLAPDPRRGDEIERYELVLRASGGGSGLYRQQEVRFRLYKGEMKAVMSFESRVQSVPPPLRYLRMERRWFNPIVPVRSSGGGGGYVGVLVESRARTRVPPDVYFAIPGLQNLYLKEITCRTFRWNPDRFEYEPVSVPNVCKLQEQ